MDNFENINVLCRIYETRNEELSTDIAEYTNSQNPVESRDIRSNDFTQKKLEAELKSLGYFYERKKGKFYDKPKDKRIDAEKAGQAIMAFFKEMPSEAKNKKGLIFSEKYDEVFSDDINADKVLLAVNLFEELEKRKKTRKKEIVMQDDYELESFILHGSYYLLYFLSELCEIKNISKINSEYAQIIALYDEAVSIMRESVLDAQKDAKNKNEYTHRVFFISNKPKIFLENYLKRNSSN